MLNVPLGCRLRDVGLQEVVAGGAPAQATGHALARTGLLPRRRPPRVRLLALHRPASDVR